MIREIFSGTDGRLSSKRIMGTLSIITGVLLNAFGVGDVDLHKTLIWGGFAAIGVGTLETRVQK